MEELERLLEHREDSEEIVLKELGEIPFVNAIDFTANLLLKEFENFDEMIKYFSDLVEEISEKRTDDGAMLSYICGIVTGHDLRKFQEKGWRINWKDLRNRNEMPN